MPSDAQLYSARLHRTLGGRPKRQKRSLKLNVHLRFVYAGTD